MHNYRAILLLSIIILQACKKDIDSPHSAPQSNQLNTNAHVVDTLSISEISAGSVTLKANTTYTPNTGDIVLAAPSAQNPYGLLVKINRVNQAGAVFKCTTEPANLNDAFKELHINYTTTNPSNESGRLNTSNSSNKPQDPATSQSTASFPFNNLSVGSGITIDGNLEINIPKTVIQYSKRPDASLPDTVIVSSSISTKGSFLRISTTAFNLPEKVIATVNLPAIMVPVPIPLVGIIPIPFSQKVKLSILPATVSGKMTFTLYPVFSATLGISYLNGEFKNLSQASNEAYADPLRRGDFDNPSSATATIIKPSYEIAPYGTEELKLYFAAPNNINLNIQSTSPNYRLKYSFGIEAGINLKFWLGKTETRKLDAVLGEKTLLQGDWKKPVWVLGATFFQALGNYLNGNYIGSTYQIAAFVYDQDDDSYKAPAGTVVKFSAESGQWINPQSITDGNGFAFNTYSLPAYEAYAKVTLSATAPDGTALSWTSEFYRP